MEQLLYLIGLILVLWAQIGVQGAYKKYKNKPNNKPLTGATVARKILNRYDLNEKVSQLEKILDESDLILKEPKYLIMIKNITTFESCVGSSI